MAERDVDVDGLQLRLGTGRFQIISFLILGLIYSRGAWHVFGIMFLAGDPGHKCALPPFDGEEQHSQLESSYAATLHNRTENLYREVHGNKPGNHTALSPEGDAFSSLPTNIDMSSSMLYSFSQGDGMEAAKVNWTAETCAVSYVASNGSSVTFVEECPYGWSYGSFFETTVLSEWNLVCNNNFLVEVSITVFMVGSTIGAMAILPLADRFGRKRVMFACLLCQAGIGTAAAFAQNYILFTALRCVIGMLNIGANLSAYVLMTEIFPAQKRTVMSIAFQGFWAVGVMTVAGFGYLVRNWRHLELLLSLPNLLALPCIWLLPESLPWLVSQKQWKETVTAVKMIARINGEEEEEFLNFLTCSSTVETSEVSLPMNIKMCTEREEIHAELANRVEAETERMITCGETRSIQHPENNTELASVGNGNMNNGCLVSKINGASIPHAFGNGENGHSISAEVKPHRKEDNGLHVGDRHSVCFGGWENGQLNMTTSLGGPEENTPQQKATSHSVLGLFQNKRMRLYSCIMFFLFFVNSLGYFGISFSVPVLHGNPFVNLAIMGAVEIPADIICILICQRIGRRYPNAMFLLLCGVSNIGALFTPSSMVLLKVFFVMLGKFAITAAYSTIYLYSAEIFPTAIRNQGMGMSSVFENIGSITAPFMVHAAKTIAELPLAVFGGLSIIGAGLTLLLPETHNKPLPQTVEEITTW